MCVCVWQSALYLPSVTSINSVSCTVPMPLVSLTSRRGVEGSVEEQWGCIKEVGRVVAGRGGVGWKRIAHQVNMCTSI